MKVRHFKIIAFILALLLIPIVVMAIETTNVYPSTNNTYYIGNRTNMYKNISAAYFYGSGEYLTGITGGGNTTAQLIAAINNSQTYNIQVKNATQVYNSSYEWFLNTTIFLMSNSSYDWFNNMTIFQTFNSTYDAKPSNTFNASYDSSLGHNTSAEVNAALNSTFTGQLGKNTTAEIRAAQLFNTTTDVRNAQLFNTTEDVRRAVFPITIEKDNITGPFGVSGLTSQNISGLNWSTVTNKAILGIGDVNMSNISYDKVYNKPSNWDRANLTGIGVNLGRANLTGIGISGLDQNNLSATFLINKNNISGAMGGENIPWANITGKGINLDRANLTGIGINLPWDNVTGKGIDLPWANITGKGINLPWENVTGKGIELNFATNVSNRSVNDLNDRNITGLNYSLIQGKTSNWPRANLTGIGTANQDFNNFTANLAMKWENLSTFNLNSAWTGTLGWGNLTGLDLNKIWLNTLGMGNITDPADCSAGQFVTGKTAGAWDCSTPAGGSGTNYWQVQGDWLTPNTSAGAKNLVNATGFNASQTINASVFWENGVLLEQKYKLAGGISLNFATNVTNRSVNDLTTSNFTANLALGFKNLTNYDFNVSWSNSLHGGNITHGTLDQDALTSSFMINKNNISGAMGGENIPWANITGKGINLDRANLTGIGATGLTQINLSSTFLINKNNVSGSFGGENIPRANITGIGVGSLNGANSTYYLPMNDTWQATNAKIKGNLNISGSLNVTNKINLYNSTICWNVACTANITYNGTHIIEFGG